MPKIETRGTLATLAGFSIKSPALYVSVMYGLAGICFAMANLMLARHLPTDQFAVFALAIAIVGIGSPLAPLGLDFVIIRRGIEASPSLLVRGGTASVALAFMMSVFAWLMYPIPTDLVVLVFLSIAAGGVTLLASGKFQNLERFIVAIGLGQSTNGFLLIAAVVMLFAGWGSASTPVAFVAVGHALAGVWGWAWLFRHRGTTFKPQSIRWTESLSLAGTVGAVLFLHQVERLMIPKVLGLSDLATFAVLATIVIAPFRMLQLGVEKTLLPRLRNATDARARRRLIVREATIVGSIAIILVPLMWFATPLVVRWFLRGKYDLGPDLLLAALAVGMAKLLSGFGNATVTALGDNRTLVCWSVLGWASVAAAAVGGAVGARWGLDGLIYGVALGWILRSIAAAWLARPYLESPGA